jgi:hypothetical protein
MSIAYRWLLTLAILSPTASLADVLEPPPPGIDLQLQSLVGDFYGDARRMGLRPGNEVSSIRVGVTSKQEWIGECLTWTTQDGTITQHTITISPDIVYEPLVLKLVLYHEMGHCVYDMPHSRHPGSIMYERAHRPKNATVLATKIRQFFFSILER